MNADRLLAHYERVADSPDAIPRLRRFILELAVRGRLAHQDPNDMQASELVVRVSEGHLSLDRSPVPTGWVQATVGSLLEFQYGRGLDVKERLDEGPVPVFGSNGIVGYCREPLTARPSVIVGRKGSAGALNLCAGPSWTTDVAYYVEQPPFFALRFLLVALQTLDLSKLGKGIKPGLSRSDAYALQMSVPPLTEQRRIVAKVDELMALCDRLEAARKEREVTRDRLAAASLVRLNAPDQAPAVFASHSHFALDNLSALTARTDQIKQLRHTIVNLAVRGKLVPQDLDDESEKACRSSNSPLLPELLPIGWRHERLADLISEDTRNGYSRKPDDAPNGTPILRISAGTIRADGIVAEEEHKLISGINPELRSTYGLERGDLLACRFNGNKSSVGRLTFFKDYLGIRPIYPDKLIRIRVERRLVLPEFLRLAGDSDLVRSEVEDLCATTVGNWGISASNLRQVRFPLPPLTEQRRIVAKVDELMELCDRLEASLVSGEDHRRRLLGALLAEALAPVEMQAAG